MNVDKNFGTDIIGNVATMNGTEGVSLVYLAICCRFYFIATGSYLKSLPISPVKLIAIYITAIIRKTYLNGS